MIYRTKYGRYIDENNIEVSQMDLQLYLESDGTIFETDFNFPEDLIPEQIEQAQKAQKELAQQLAFQTIVNQQQSLPDADALEVQAIYPLWDGDFKTYSLNDKVQAFNANAELLLYKCVQAHTSQPTFNPYLTPALWTQIQPAGIVGVWVQPTGAQDAYQIGDLVHFPTINDPIYRSTTANNVWAPNVFGWVLN